MAKSWNHLLIRHMRTMSQAAGIIREVFFDARDPRACSVAAA
jgi:hypothetical protein